MPKDVACPVTGCDHAPFQNVAALKAHVRAKHPDYSGAITDSGEAREVPIVEEDFATLLRKFKIKADLARNIAENISHTGGPNVFEDPQKLFQRLTAWSTEISPATRKLILEQWFAEKGITIPTEVLSKAALKPEEIKKEEAKTGEVRYVYDAQHKAVRMAQQSESGGTLEEAKELKKMAEEADTLGKESPFIPGPDGKFILNPKARITGVEYMAAKYMEKADAAGTPLDPIEAMAQAADKMKMYQEVLGGGAGKATSITDMVALITTIQSLSGGSGASEAIRKELDETKQALRDLKEEGLRGTIETQNKQIAAVTSSLNSVLAEIEKLRHGAVGRTEMDIIHEIASSGLTFIREELPAFRGDVKAALGGGGLGGAKSEEAREQRKGKYRQALQEDKEIEEAGRKLFFEQS